MNAILILLAVSSLLGLVLGFYFSWLAIGVSGLVLAFLSAVVLQREGFGSLAGIAIIVACLTVNQIAYLIGVMSMNRGRSRSNIRDHLVYIGWLVGTRDWLASEHMSYEDLAAAARLSLLDYLGGVPWGSIAIS